MFKYNPYLYLLEIILHNDVSYQGHTSVPKSEEIESGQMVLEKVKWTYFWCISITNNVKPFKKFNEKAEKGRIHCFCKTLYSWQFRKLNIVTVTSFWERLLILLTDPKFEQQ